MSQVTIPSGLSSVNSGLIPVPEGTVKILIQPIMSSEDYETGASINLSAICGQQTYAAQLQVPSEVGYCGISFVPQGSNIDVTISCPSMTLGGIIYFSTDGTFPDPLLNGGL